METTLSPMELMRRARPRVPSSSSCSIWCGRSIAGARTQLEIDWREVLPAYFVCLSATADGEEYAREVRRTITDFADGDRTRLLRDARSVADLEQKRALRNHGARTSTRANLESDDSRASGA